jgi:hypothetical protein
MPATPKTNAPTRWPAKAWPKRGRSPEAELAASILKRNGAPILGLISGTQYRTPMFRSLQRAHAF